MAYERTIGELKVLHPVCLYFRSKAMYVTGDVEPTHVDEADMHTQNCWCNKTQHTIGPDEIDVNRLDCNPSRQCYQAR